MSNRRFLITAAVLVVGIVVSFLFGRLGHPFASVGYRKLKIPFEEFPMKVGDWVGHDRPLTKREIEIAGLDRYLRREYRTPDGDQILLYLCYYGNKSRGLRSIYHNPTICFPSAGWKWAKSEQRRVLPEDTADPFEVSLDTFQDAMRELVVLNFFIIDGEILERTPRNEPFYLALSKLKPSTDPGYFVQAQVVCHAESGGGSVGRTAVRFLEEAGHYILLHF